MLDKKYYVNVGKGGTFKPSPSARSAQYDTTPEHIDMMFNGMKNTPPGKLAIYFHGGLVNVHEGMESAKDFTKEMLDKTGTYPISFVWETGLFETLSQDFNTIKSSKLFKKLLEKIIKIAARKLGIDFSLTSLEGVRGGESMSYEEIENELQQELPFENYVFRNATRSTMGPITDEELKLEIEEEMHIEIEADHELQDLFEQEKTEEEAKALRMDELSDSEEQRTRGVISTVLALKPLIKIVYRIIKRHIKGRDHGFYPTVIEELIREFYIANLGSLVWSSMKTKGEAMWVPTTSTGLNQRAGAYFITALEKYIEKFPTTEIDLLGHSAGSIVICRLLQNLAAKGSKIKFKKIIFLAPACRCELFVDAVLGNRERFNFFRMFTMKNEYEIKDRMIPYIYTRSLLYLVSGALENHGEDYDAAILGLQRHNSADKPYEKVPSIKEIQDYFLEDEQRLVYSVTGEEASEGFRSHSKAHGAFNDVGEVTMDSVIYLLS